MLKYKNIYKNDNFVVAIYSLVAITVVAGIMQANFDEKFSLVTALASSSNFTNDGLPNKTQDTEEMMFSLFSFSNTIDNHSSKNLSQQLLILDQTDYNTNFKLIPNITGMVTEVPFVGNGTIKGISYNHTGFFSGVWNIPHNILQYYGAVNLTTIDGDEASYSLQGLSKIDDSGDVYGKGIAYFNTDSTGNISSLDGIKIFYEDNIKNPTVNDSPHRIIGWKIQQS